MQFTISQTRKAQAPFRISWQGAELEVVRGDSQTFSWSAPDGTTVTLSGPIISPFQAMKWVIAVDDSVESVGVPRRLTWREFWAFQYPPISWQGAVAAEDRINLLQYKGAVRDANGRRRLVWRRGIKTRVVCRARTTNEFLIDSAMVTARLIDWD